MKKVYENGFKDTAQLSGEGFNAEKFDADHSIHKLSAIYTEFPSFQSFSTNEDLRLQSLRQQFEQTSGINQESKSFFSSQVIKDFPRFNIKISSNGQVLYHSGGTQESGEPNIAQAFETIESYYIDRIGIPIEELRKNIGLALHTRTQGFDDQSVYLIEHFLSFGKNMDFRIGNSTHTVHILALEGKSIDMKTQTVLELSVPLLKETESMQIGKFLVTRSMSFDIVSGRCSEQIVTIEKNI